MGQTIIQSILAVVLSAVIWGLSLTAKRNPKFMSNTEEGKERERKWAQLYYRTMCWTALVMLVGSLVSLLLLKSSLLYLIFLAGPIVIACVYLVIRNITQSGSDGERKSMTADIVSVVIAVVAVAVAVFYICRSSSSDLDVQFGDESLQIKGQYGMVVNYEDIAHVQLCDSLPAISYRSNGYEFGKVRLGHFKLRGGGTVTLFDHSADSHYILIKHNSLGDIYLSAKEPESTDKVYHSIQKKLIRHHGPRDIEPTPLPQFPVNPAE